MRGGITVLAVSRTATFLAQTATTLLSYEVRERFTPAAERPALLQAYRRAYCRRMLDLFGVHVTIEGHDRVTPDAAGARLVVANHRSVLDIPILLSLFGGHLLSRADVGTWPLLGALTRRAGTIFVDRQSRHSGAHAIRAIRNQLKAGQTVIVFPEGTTHAGDEVRPFRAGAFAAARGLEVDVVPVGLAYDPGTEYVGMSFPEHLQKVAERPTTRVSASIGTSIPAGSSSADLAVACRASVQELIRSARGAMERAKGKVGP